MNILRLFSFSSLFFFSILVSAQEPLQYRFRVYLKDKGAIDYSINQPEKFLTKTAIERKQRQNAKIDESDFPISSDYFTQLEKAGGQIVSFSKWFSTIVVQLKDSAQITNIQNLSFVDSAKYVWRGKENKNYNAVRPRLGSKICLESNKSESYFGITEKQFAMHNAKNMLQNGFGGKGINIAVIDAGFTNVDVIPHFNMVAGYKNFVPWGEVFATSDHGTSVYSTMALNLPTVIMGSAPDAKYWLLRSEDVSSEFPVEEDYWVRAVEYADSIGIDVVTTSLGYTSFDDKNLNYEHSHLDGKTSFMTLASDVAFEKGMLLVTSAGNEGNKKWKKISPPADAKYTITVGAVASDSTIAPFSSMGFTADKRVKPDVVSVGFRTYTIGQNGLIRTANGTSFSTPFFAGLIASLWSINPDLPRSQVVDIVKTSADRYATPDSVFGYGIPDFGKAVPKMLATLKPVNKKFTIKSWSIESSASGNAYQITLTEPNFNLTSYSIVMMDENGNLLHQYQFNEENSVQLPLPPEVKQNNRFIHFAINEPFMQKTIRIKL